MNLQDYDIKIQKVGEPFGMFQGKNDIGECCCVMEALHGGGYALIVYLDRMTEEEKYHLNKSKISVRCIKEGDYILNLFRFGTSGLIFENSFDVTLYLQRNDERFKTLGENNMLTVVGVDSSNNIVQTIRQVSINPSIFKMWVENWNKSLRVEDFSTKYANWVRDLDSRYSVLQLWEYANYLGKLGE